jgi:hypothetical protein
MDIKTTVMIQRRIMVTSDCDYKNDDGIYNSTHG